MTVVLACESLTCRFGGLTAVHDVSLAFELGEACQFDWSDVAAAERYWAELLRYRLCMRRGASNCVKPAQ